MDNSSFPKILEFKNKMPPDPQTLRLKDWFSRYDFTVKHIKGKQNLIPDLLSRPNKPIQLFTHNHSFPLIMMIRSLPSGATTFKDFPPGLNPSCPLSAIQDYARRNIFYYMAKIMRTIKTIPDLSPVHPDTPFYLPFLINPKVQFTEDHLWYLWCTTCLYVMPVLIPTEAMYHYLMEPTNHGSLIWTALQWYSPLEDFRY